MRAGGHGSMRMKAYCLSERQRVGRSLPLMPDLWRGMGAWLVALARARKREQLLEMALGVFDAAGGGGPRVHPEAGVPSGSGPLGLPLGGVGKGGRKEGGNCQ